MALFGLQPDFNNALLSDYFCGKNVSTEPKEIYIGLGLEQQGAQVNTEDFTEVFAGRPLGNYSRERVIFGKAVDGAITNLNDVIFSTASEDWSTPNAKISMIGIFDTMDYEKADTKELIKPLVVFALPSEVTALRGETIILRAGTITLAFTNN